VIPRPYERQRPRRIRARGSTSEFLDQPRFADACLRDERHEPAGGLPDGGVELARKRAELALPADDRAAIVALDGVGFLN